MQVFFMPAYTNKSSLYLHAKSGLAGRHLRFADDTKFINY